MNFAFVECTKCLKLVNFEWKHLKSLLNPVVYRRFSEKKQTVTLHFDLFALF